MNCATVENRFSPVSVSSGVQGQFFFLRGGETSTSVSVTLMQLRMASARSIPRTRHSLSQGLRIWCHCISGLVLSLRIPGKVSATSSSNGFSKINLKPACVFAERPLTDKPRQWQQEPEKKTPRSKMGGKTRCSLRKGIKSKL